MPRRNRAVSDPAAPPPRTATAAAEQRHGRTWTVRPVPADRAEKDYRCPGCGGRIAAGVAHVVVWRADGVLGDAADLDARRHWHAACWRVA